MISAASPQAIRKPANYTEAAKTRSSWPPLLKVYAIVHGLWFCLYAILGKGFAYLGWPPFYVGEFLVLISIPAFVYCRRFAVLLRTRFGVLLATFFLWQIACTLPYVSSYGMDALRDSVLWAYGVLACVTAALILRLPGSIEKIVVKYRWFAGQFLIWGPIACLATLHLRDWLPRIPGTSVTVPALKTGEYCVHLAGIFAFAILGFSKGKRWWALLVLPEIVLGITGRGGLVAFLGASAFVMLIRPRIERLIPSIAISVILIVAMAAFDFRVDVPGSGRELSLDQLSVSLQSVVGPSSLQSLEGTKNWRLAWWRKIWTYTVDGPFFWLGKGYGINLADSDGFQVGSRDEPLRSPHSSHLTFLARSGVPGFILWVLLQMTWAGSMIVSYASARRRALESWAALLAWILAYWIAFIVCAGFDVFLEGPMAGIPFWTLIGLGWGAQILFRSQLEANPTFVTSV